MKLDWKELLASGREIFSKNKKMIFISVGSLVGVILLITIFSSIFSIWDQKHAIYYEVTFNTNGGTAIATQRVRKGRMLNESIQTEKTGFDFIGWSYEGEDFDLKTPIQENMQLIANWKENGTTIIHTVSFNTYGGTPVEKFEVSEGRTFNKPFNPTKEGYQFLGWYWNEKLYDFVKTGVSQDITLKAKWERLSPLEETKEELERSATLFQQISGTWYLKGYEDIYLTITEEDNGFGDNWYFLKWYNIDILGDFSYYNYFLYQNTFSFEKAKFYQEISKFRFYLKGESLTFEHSGKEYSFVKEKGTKNKYTETLYQKAVGRWYLENTYSSYIDVEAEKTDNILDYDSYCIRTTNINLGTLQLGSSMEYGCMKAYDESLFKKLGIRVDESGMIVENEFGKKRFTKDKSATEGAVTGIKLDKVTATLENGKTMMLFATVMPKEATNTKVIWESSNPEIVTVTGNPNMITIGSEGVRYSATLISKKPGNATITAKTVDGGYIATSKIVVPGIEVETLTLNKTESLIYVGNFEQLKATISPVNASSKKLIWSSSNSSVASVSTNGNIQGKKEGTATITVMTEDGKKKASCLVTVKYPTLKVVTAVSDTTKLIDGTYQKGIFVMVNASGGSGVYQKYQIKFYYNHQLVKEGNSATLFYPTELSGKYYVEIIVVDSVGHQVEMTKEYTKK